MEVWNIKFRMMMTEKLEFLVVEDGPANLKAAKKFFSGVSLVHADYATNYAEAMELMANKDYVAAIFDRNMPERKGLWADEVGPYGDLLLMEAKKRGIVSVIMTARVHGQDEFALIVYNSGENGGTATAAKSNVKSWKDAYGVLSGAPLEILSRAKGRLRTAIGKSYVEHDAMKQPEEDTSGGKKN